ncbi:MAG: glycosyl hydrolase, partial [Gemmatimonadales bacterium]|nr:glycosyl hydrolase [Gemmatimonadales bacterium]
MTRLAPASLVLLLALTPSRTLPAQPRANPPRAAAGTPPGAATQRPDSAAGPRAAQFSGLRFRGIGPANASGRVGELAIHPSDKSTWYVGVHSGGVWKTVNAGTTWTSIFDGQGSYSIGTVVVDPANPLTIWVGTGENNGQRSVGWGDGVYKSTDGGRTWNNTGLKSSFHIGRILVDPRNSDVVYAAAIGSMWSPGGDRGVWKTADGGKTWTQSLKPENDWTGAYELAFDAGNPDVLYATTWQRGRRQWGFIDGGPGSAVWKSADAGKSWSKLSRGLPNEEFGKIGLAVSPANSKTIYVQVEAANRAGGFFRSRDGGQNFERMSTTVGGPPFYYHKLAADPKNVDRVYAVNVQMQVTEDAGRTFRSIQGRSMHVDNHAVWIDPEDTDHLLVGNDGGLYETRDRGATWRFMANLPITQFYKVDVDNAEPFYNICGGTQDNNTLCGPSQTRNGHGTLNADWFIVVGGDGFQPRIDPTNPDLIYGQSQHGELARYDRKTGERVPIQPQPEPGEPASRWHWDAPLIISPHANARLYFSSQRVYRSDDRGDTWRPVSGDLSRQLDRNRLPIMGRVWSVDAVAKNTSTSLWGAVVSFAESPKKEGVLWAGTDDGLVNVTEDGGQNWRKLDSIPGVPKLAFVADIEPSNHDPNVAYAVFNNHKQGDYAPYLYKTTDGGRSWASVTGDLPAGQPVWTMVEDHVDPNLLFAGTEIGAFFSLDGGKKWLKFGNGLPTIQVRDLAIQKRENDLVVATFGRGFYILHDYRPLRQAARTLAQRAALLPVKDARMFVPATPLGGGPRGSQGDDLYTVANPPAGAVITYYLRDPLRTLRQRRQAAERSANQRNADVYYPPWDSLRAEENEEPPAVVLTVSDEQGNVVRRLTGPVGAGFQRVVWDLRHHGSAPVTGQGGG